ncbi:MAG TPA: hypothetical protein VFX85_01115 [Solirubrobacterales bacterium]|nr:hypothetical protein [Solirubrobacterales bacterium]
MSVRARRFRKPALVLLAFAALAVVLSACAYYKPGSLQVTQPGEIGSVRIHMAFCVGYSEAEQKCKIGGEDEVGQTYIGLAVTKGAIAPETIAAIGEPPSAPPLVFHRNQSVAEALGRLETEEGEPSWPPPGTEIIGYMSEVMPSLEGENFEWTIDPEFGLPVPADGGPYGGSFLVALASGNRNVDAASPTDIERPAYCPIGKEESVREECRILKDARQELRVTDLRVKSEGAAPTVQAGGEATLPFKLEVGTTALTIPSFALGAATNLPGTTATLANPLYKPDVPTDASRRTSTSREVKVKVPADAKAGTYAVTLTAKTTAGASVSQTSSFTVTAQPPPPPKANLRLGKLTLNKAKGTAVLPVQVSAAGTLQVSGRKIVKVGAKATGPQTLKVSIRAKGKAKKKLNQTGKATVKTQIAFTPTAGAAVLSTRSITLKKTLP